MKRAIFGFIWWVVFFIAAVVSISLFVSYRAGGGEQGLQASNEAGKALAVPVFFGSIVLAVILSYLGILPGTGQRQSTYTPRRKSAASEIPESDSPDERAPTRKPLDPNSIEEASSAWAKEQYGYGSSRVSSSSQSTVMPAASEGGHSTEHVFNMSGFMEEWKLIAPGAAIFAMFGFCMLGAMKDKAEGTVWVGLVMVALAMAPICYMAYRFAAVRWARLDDEGVNWGGMLGDKHQDWDNIVEVFRSEKVVVNRDARSKSMHLKFADGSGVRFDQALTDFDELAGSIQATTGDLLLRRKMEELADRGKAEFGPVSVREDGVEMKGEFFRWTELGSHKIENGHLVLYKLGRGRRDGGNKGTPLAEIPNYLVLLHFMDCRGMPK